MENRLLPYWDSRGKGLDEKRTLKTVQMVIVQLVQIKMGSAVVQLGKTLKNEIDLMKLIVH